MHVADPALAKTAHCHIDEIALPENALRSLNELAARHGGMRLLAQALDQPHAETPLEFADLQADRRLRQVETARRGRETAVLDRFDDSGGPQKGGGLWC